MNAVSNNLYLLPGAENRFQSWFGQNNVVNQKVKDDMTNNDRSNSWCGTDQVGMAVATPYLKKNILSSLLPYMFPMIDCS